MATMISRVQSGLRTATKPIAGKLQQHTQKLGEEMANGAELDQLIRAALGGLGYEF
ncbi:MAG: hypothetical protein IPN06_04700 [Burkholderiales bacterium]|nr:hypothetical protein [Burkholderiales bacterium]